MSINDMMARDRVGLPNPIGTDYNYKRAALDQFSDEEIAQEHAKRLGRRKSS